MRYPPPSPHSALVRRFTNIKYTEGGGIGDIPRLFTLAIPRSVLLVLQNAVRDLEHDALLEPSMGFNKFNVVPTTSAPTIWLREVLDEEVLEKRGVAQQWWASNDKKFRETLPGELRLMVWE
jgi:hypothetical protein